MACLILQILRFAQRYLLFNQVSKQIPRGKPMLQRTDHTPTAAVPGAIRGLASGASVADC
jgi:hypothetical protein